MKKKVLKTIVIILLIFIGLFVIFLIFASITDYKPDDKITLYKNGKTEVLRDSTFNLLIWNIGYCGLDSEMDFFYDGGKNVRQKKTKVFQNLESVKKQLIQSSKIYDFILLQEVDINSKRSYNINQFDTITKYLANYKSFFGTNYKVPFIPIPINSPMGKVYSGLANFMKYSPQEVKRFSFPGNYSWPKSLFMLDRCFLLTRYKLPKSKELIVINTHNSAYDDGGLRMQQMKFIKKILLEEFQKGNYIIVGGDWNQCPPDFTPNFNEYIMDNENKLDIPKDYLENWQWVYDNTSPTNRRVAIPFDQKKSKTTVIDFYLISPNIEIIQVNNINLNFKNSDHNPVSLKIKLK